MQHAELYDSFGPLLAEFQQHQGFVEKTQLQAGKFAQNVIDRLIKKHTDALMESFERIVAVLPDVDAAVEDLATQQAGIAGGRDEHQFNLDVLRLELVIEQITQDEFHAASEQTQSELAAIDASVSEIAAEHTKFQALMDEWAEVAIRAGVLE